MRRKGGRRGSGETNRADSKQAQTPQQRKANDKFKKAQDAKRGKPASEIKKKDDFKSPISPLWLGKLCSLSLRGILDWHIQAGRGSVGEPAMGQRHKRRI